MGRAVTASRAARERKAAAEAGPLARVRIDLDAQQQFVYKISCTVCVARGDRPWSAYRPRRGQRLHGGDGPLDLPPHREAPGGEAPCLAYLGAARERLHARRSAP